MILTWFGEWPGWMRLFLQSCRYNPSIDWLIVTDCGDPGDLPLNVRLLETSFEDYRAFIGARLGITPQWRDAYKLCDIKPALGAIHAEQASRYDFWGFGDLDVIYGDIRAVYTPDVLAYDLISTHAGIVAGHFCLLRSAPRMTFAFKRIRFWRSLLERDRHCSFDEQIFSRLFLPMDWRKPWRRLQTPFLGGALFAERYSTSIPPLPYPEGANAYPTEWIWREGKLTNNASPSRGFLYLHFSHWQSARWTSENAAPWTRITQIDALPPGRPSQFRITRDGFLPLPGPLA